MSEPGCGRFAIIALRSVAKRALILQAEAKEMEVLLGVLVEQVAPQLLRERGIGSVTATQLVVSWSHQGRVRSEAAFASLARRQSTSSKLRRCRQAPTQPRR